MELNGWKGEIGKAVARSGPAVLLLAGSLWWVAQTAFPQMMAQQQRAIDAFSTEQQQAVTAIEQNGEILSETLEILVEDRVVQRQILEKLDRLDR